MEMAAICEGKLFIKVSLTELSSTVAWMLVWIDCVQKNQLSLAFFVELGYSGSWLNQTALAVRHSVLVQGVVLGCVGGCLTMFFSD